MVALAVCLSAGPSALAIAAPPNSKEVERLYVEGQQLAEAKDFNGAADSWTRLLTLLPESGDNQAIRESVLINVLDARMKAYNQLVDSEGRKDIEHLRKGKAALDRYYADFSAVHGDRVAVSAAVQDKAAELEKALADAEKAEKAAPPPEPEGETESNPERTDPTPNAPKKLTDDTAVRPQNDGKGLIIGGAVVGALGVGAIVMIIAGAVVSKKSETQFNKYQKQANEATDQAVKAKAQSNADGFKNQGDTANKIAYAGIPLAVVFLAGSAVMLYYGIKARRHAASAHASRRPHLDGIAPRLGRGFVGLGVSGRF